MKRFCTWEGVHRLVSGIQFISLCCIYREMKCCKLSLEHLEFPSLAVRGTLKSSMAAQSLRASSNL